MGSLLDCHRRLFVFDHWANVVALERLNHILGASRIWLARATGETPSMDLHPSFDPTALRRELEAAREGWRVFLDEQTDPGLSRVITFGRTQRVQLVDILTHLPLHGQQHRGQVNVDLRAAGALLGAGALSTKSVHGEAGNRRCGGSLAGVPTPG